jgi:probable FeS assembly SUF system protein SufT
MSEVRPADPAITIRAETLLADPDTCKFTVSQTVYPVGPFFFDSKERAAGSPLVERLFALAGVANVLVTDNVVTVGKQPSTPWSELKSAIGTAIRTQLLTGVPTILDTPDNRSFTGVLTSTRNRRPGKHEVRVELKRDCVTSIIPSGEKLTLAQGDTVVVTQALGGSFTVRTESGYLVRVAALDADALGLEGAPEQEAPGEAGPFSLEKVIEQLKTVFDPEIPVNVVDLGLIYVCEAHPLADGGHWIEIKMSMTAPGCGMGDVLKEDARAKVQGVPGVAEVDIEIVWEPAWDQSRMSEAAQLQLGMY